MKRSLLIFAAFYSDLTPKCGSTIRIAGYTKDLEMLNIDYTFVSNIKPAYVAASHHVVFNFNLKLLKFFVLHNILYSTTLLKPLSYVLQFFLIRLHSVKRLKKISENALIWTPQEYTVSLFLFNVYKQPFIYDIHGFFDIQREYRVGLNLWRKMWFDLYLLQERIVLREAPFLNVVSNRMKDYVNKRFNPKGKVLIAPDGIPVDIIEYQQAQRDIRTELGIAGKDKIICYAGSFKKIGGVTELVKLYCSESEINRQSVLLLIGSGQEESNVHNEIVKWNCASRVFQLKSVPHSELIGYMKAADLIVCPDIEGNAYNEMTPHIKLYDAVASGSQVLATDFEVNKETFDERQYNIRYFSYYKVGDFKQKMLEVLNKKNINQPSAELLGELTYASRLKQYIADYGNQIQITQNS